MFRKLVANLPFSPALVGQLGFYAKRLRAEETTRRLGLIFTALALVVQSFAVFSPPESANAAHPSDIIYGGVNSVADVLSVYDASARGNGDFKKIMDYAGITRAELAATKSTTINSWEFGHTSNTNVWLTWGRMSYMSAAMGEVKHTIGGTTVYSKPLWRYDTGTWSSKNGSNYPAFRGYSAKMGHFAIQKDCGNLLTTHVPVPPAPLPDTKTISVCRPGTGVISVKETDKQTTDLPATSDACKPRAVPFADCSMLTAKLINRTTVNLTATSVVKNGATVSNYGFTIRESNPSGKIVAEKTIPASVTALDSGNIDLKNPGSYHAAVVVKTSTGDKAPLQCTTTITIEALAKCALNPTLNETDAQCQPCVGDASLWYKDVACTAQVHNTKTARNLTQNISDASTTTANASDRIQFTLTMKNEGNSPATTTFAESMRDVMEYATIQDNGGGILNAESKVLSWGSVTLAPGESTSRSFVIKVLDTIPATPQGISEPSSYDCRMTNTFGNTVGIEVACDGPKVLEASIDQLPSTGASTNLVFGGILAAIVTFFYARSRQMSKEVRLIRKEFNMGTI